MMARIGRNCDNDLRRHQSGNVATVFPAVDTVLRTRAAGARTRRPLNRSFGAARRRRSTPGVARVDQIVTARGRGPSDAGRVLIPDNYHMSHARVVRVCDHQLVLRVNFGARRRCRERIDAQGRPKQIKNLRRRLPGVRRGRSNGQAHREEQSRH